jgi:hypothetical protein
VDVYEVYDCVAEGCAVEAWAECCAVDSCTVDRRLCAWCAVEFSAVCGCVMDVCEWLC